MTTSQGACCAKQTISKFQSLCYTPSKLFNCKYIYIYIYSGGSRATKLVKHHVRIKYNSKI